MPEKYLDIRELISEMDSWVLASSLSGTQAATIFGKRVLSLRKKKAMKTIAKMAMPKSATKPATPVITLETIETLSRADIFSTTNFWILKSSPRKEKVSLRYPFRLSSGCTREDGALSTLALEMSEAMLEKVGTIREMTPRKADRRIIRVSTELSHDGIRHRAILILSMRFLSGLPTSESTAAPMMYKRTGLMPLTTRTAIDSKAAMKSSLASLSTYLPPICVLYLRVLVKKSRMWPSASL